jgi:hypothetical protein
VVRPLIRPKKGSYLANPLTGRDGIAIDRDGKPLLDSNGNSQKVYGWDNVVNLAARQPDDVRNAPDAYAIFGNAMFFDNFDWSSGRAVPVRQV